MGRGPQATNDKKQQMTNGRTLRLLDRIGPVARFGEKRQILLPSLFYCPLPIFKFMNVLSRISSVQTQIFSISDGACSVSERTRVQEVGAACLDYITPLTCSDSLKFTALLVLDLLGDFLTSFDIQYKPQSYCTDRIRRTYAGSFDQVKRKQTLSTSIYCQVKFIVAFI